MNKNSSSFDLYIDILKMIMYNILTLQRPRNQFIHKGDIS